LRADVSNLLNRTTRNDPVNDLADPSFGRILNVSGQRQFQFTGRIRF
jgi:hypothetical protein